LDWTRLREIGFISPRNNVADDKPASFVPMTLIPAEYGVDAKHEVRPWGEIKSGFTHFADGDIALAKITPCFENGKSTIFRGLTGGIGAGTTELHVIRPVFVNGDYVFVFLKSPHFIESGIPKMTGTAGQKRVPTDYFADSPFPLAPLAEQHRIVAKVDELMALCDRLEVVQTEGERRRDRVTAASLSRLNQPSSKAPTFREHARFQLDHLHRFITQPRHVEQLRQTIVNLAVRGHLLGGIGVIQGRGNKVGDFVSFLNGYAFESKSFASRGVRLCRNVNVGHGSLNWRPANSAHVSEATAAEFQRYRLTAGDIVLSLDRPLISTGLKAAKIRQDDLPCLLLQRVAKAEFLSNDVDPDFFLRWLQSSDFTSAIDPGRSKGVPHISTRQVESLGFIPPDRPEQERIVAKVNELMVICDRLESSLTTSQAESRRLLEAVLHDALASTSDEGLDVARNPMSRIAVGRGQRP
jgi:type I restriction enzyme, S subunit